MDTKDTLAGFVLLAIMLIIIGFGTHHDYNQLEAKIKPQTFYNGEGDALPNKAVELLVLSQYAKITPAEADTLNKYFYSTKH